MRARSPDRSPLPCPKSKARHWVAGPPNWCGGGNYPSLNGATSATKSSATASSRRDWHRLSAPTQTPGAFPRSLETGSERPLFCTVPSLPASPMTRIDTGPMRTSTLNVADIVEAGCSANHATIAASSIRLGFLPELVKPKPSIGGNRGRLKKSVSRGTTGALIVRTDRPQSTQHTYHSALS